MDSGRFDAFTRSFAHDVPRRAVLRLAAGTLAALIAERVGRAGAQDEVSVDGGVAVADAGGGSGNAAAVCGPCPECRVCDPTAGGCAPDPGQDGRRCDPGDPCATDAVCLGGRCEGRTVRNGDRCGTDQVCCDGQCCAPGRECRGGLCEVAATDPDRDPDPDPDPDADPDPRPDPGPDPGPDPSPGPTPTPTPACRQVEQTCTVTADCCQDPADPLLCFPSDDAPPPATGFCVRP